MLIAANLSAGQDVSPRQATVFELAGQDRAGMLADITDLMSHNSCHVRSAAVSSNPAHLYLCFAA